MAGKPIKKNEVIEDNIFSNLKLSAEQAQGAIVALESSLEAVSALAKTMKGNVPKGAPVDSKGVAELNAQQQKANDLAKARMEIDKQLVKEKLKLQEANKQVVAALKEEILLEQKGLGTLERVKIESNQLRKEREKLNLSTAEGSKRLKEINVVLDKNNAIVRESADNLKRQTLNVGNYEGAIKPLKTQLREMTTALQNMDEAHPDFNRMVAEAGQLRDKISDTKAVIEATAGSGVENMAKGLAGVGSIGVQAFQGIEGGMALFGVESESVVKTLVKLQALAALSDSLKGLGALGDTMTQIKASFAAAAVQLGIFTAAKEVDTVVTGVETVATEGATIATKGLGASMKALPIVAIIAGIAALAYGIYSLTSGNEEAAKATKKRAEAEKAANAELKKSSEFIAKESTEFVGLIYQLKATNKSSEERSVLIDKINSQYGTTLKNLSDENLFQQQLNNSANEYIQIQINKYKLQQNDEWMQKNIAKQQTALNIIHKERNRLHKEYPELLDHQIETMIETNHETRQAVIDNKEATDALLMLGIAAGRLTSNQEKLTQGGKVYVGQSAKTTKSTKDQTDATDELNKAIMEEIALQETRAEQALARKNSEKEVLDAIDLQIEKDAAARALEDEITDEKRQEAALAARQKAEEDAAELAKQKEEEALQKRYELAKNYTDASNEYAQKALDEKLGMLDKEIEASQKQQNVLADLAANGNIEAQQSLTEQYKIEAEAARKKAELEKRKQEFAIISQTINSFLQARAAGENVGAALASAGGDAAVLQGLVAMLPTFLEGTENTGKVSNPLDSNGGRLAVIHDEERILTKEHNAIIGDMSNAELVNRVQLSRFKDTTMDAAPSGWDNAAIIAELQGVKQAIKSQPIPNLELGRITQKTMEIVQTIKKDKVITKNTFRVS